MKSQQFQDRACFARFRPSRSRLSRCVAAEGNDRRPRTTTLPAEPEVVAPAAEWSIRGSGSAEVFRATIASTCPTTPRRPRKRRRTANGRTRPPSASPDSVARFAGNARPTASPPPPRPPKSRTTRIAAANLRRPPLPTPPRPPSTRLSSSTEPHPVDAIPVSSCPCPLRRSTPAAETPPLLLLRFRNGAAPGSPVANFRRRRR